MAASLLRSARASVLVLSALAALGASACVFAVESDSGLTPSTSPTGEAGAGGSGGGGGTGGSDNDWGVGGGFSAACQDGSLPFVSASYLDAGPDAGDSGASERDAAAPPTDGGALDGGVAPGDAGTGLSVPRRIRVAVATPPPFLVEKIQELGPGVVLLPAPPWSEGAWTIDLLVSTSHPWVDILRGCGEYASVPLSIELVLHDSSVDAIVSSPSWI